MKANLKIRLGFFIVLATIVGVIGIGVMFDISLHSQAGMGEMAKGVNHEIREIAGQTFGVIRQNAAGDFEAVQLTRDLQAAFLNQLLAWKNYLVRGQFADMRDKYSKLYIQGDKDFKELAVRVESHLGEIPEAMELLKQIMSQYTYLDEQIRVAKGMMDFHDTYLEGARAADQYTGDKGLSTIQFLRKLSDVVAEHAQDRFEATSDAKLQQMQGVIDTAGEKTTGAQNATREKLIWVSLATAVGLVLALAVNILYVSRLVVRPIERLNERLGMVAEDIACEAEELSMASGSLAEGVSHQAASMQQTKASIEELTGQATANTQGASEVCRISAEAEDISIRGMKEMARMNQAMREIEEAATQVFQISKVIDGIAFQTNILSLNAAVEAARAGEAGAGFGVIADEVRKLAVNTAGAAREASELIENSMQKSKLGGVLCDSLEKAFGEIKHSVTNVHELVSKISQASVDQTQGISQISEAVAEVDHVTQRASASALQTADTAEELNHQAGELRVVLSELAYLIAGTSKASGSPKRRDIIESDEGVEVEVLDAEENWMSLKQVA